MYARHFDLHALTQLALCRNHFLPCPSIRSDEFLSCFGQGAAFEHDLLALAADDFVLPLL